MRTDRGKGHVRIGRLLFTHDVAMTGESPLLDGCSTTLRHEPQGDLESFGGIAIRMPWQRRSSLTGYSIGWLGIGVPHPARLRPRYLAARMRWVLAGRPPVQPLTSACDFYAMPGGPA